MDLHLNIADDYAHWSLISKQYPKHVSVFRQASLYARIAEPKNLHELVISGFAPSYRLETSTKAFNVTSRGGIIYVSNVAALHVMSDTLKWVFKILYYLKWVLSCPFTLIKWLILFIISSYFGQVNTIYPVQKFVLLTVCAISSSFISDSHKCLVLLCSDAHITQLCPWVRNLVFHINVGAHI